MTPDPGRPLLQLQGADLPQVTWPLEGWSRPHVDGFHPSPLQAVRSTPARPSPPAPGAVLLAGRREATSFCPAGHLRLSVWVRAHRVLSTRAELRTGASAPLLQRAPPSGGGPPASRSCPGRAFLSSSPSLSPRHRGLREKLLQGFHTPAALAQGPGRVGRLRAWATGVSVTRVVFG